MRWAICYAILTTLLLSASTAIGGVRLSLSPLNGGLVGVRLPDPVIQDATRDSAGVQVPMVGFKRVIADASYEWFPAVAASIVFRLADDDDDLGWGVGAHFVVYQVRGEDGKRTSPALTLHYGTAKNQAFAGVLLTQRGDVRLPGGRKEVIVPAGTENSFNATRSSKDGGLNFYAGVVLASFNLPGN